MTRVIRGYRYGQQGGFCLVTIDDAMLPMPDLGKDEARHSPDGFQWEYGGSGPAELARAILVALYPDDSVVREPRCYQQFKWDVIARLCADGWTTTSEEIDAWYATWRTNRAEKVGH